MTLKSDRQHWGDAAKFFHWTIVLLILMQAAVGLIMVDLPKRPNIVPIYSFHKSVGMTILALAVLRLAWRAFDPRPLDAPGTLQWQSIAARGGHALLYLLLFLVPMSGWWFDSVSGLRPLYWFGLFEIPHFTAPDPTLKDMARDRHEFLFWMLALVAAGHAVMALFHQFIKHDNVLGRMWPASLQRRSTPETSHVAPNPPSIAAASADPARSDRA